MSIAAPTNIRAYDPVYIKQWIDSQPRGVVTSDQWDELWNLIISQGDYNADSLVLAAAEITNLQDDFTELDSYVRNALEAITAGMVPDGSITTARLADGAVTKDKIQLGHNTGIDIDAVDTQHAYQLKNYYAVASSTTGAAYTVSVLPLVDAYFDGLRVTIKPSINCLSGPTLKVNDLAAVPIYNNASVVVAAGELQANRYYDCMYVGGKFYLVSSGTSILYGSTSNQVPTLAIGQFYAKYIP